MFTIRDVKETDREVLFAMEKEFYEGPACDHTVPEENFEATLKECLRSRQYARMLMLEDETGVVSSLRRTFLQTGSERQRLWNKSICMGRRRIPGC